MDSPNRVAVRSSLIDSIKACTLAGAQIPKEELKRRISMPDYLRLAMRKAIESKDIDAALSYYNNAAEEDAPEAPLVVFINSKSGGRYGPQLKQRLQDLMTQEQVKFLALSYSLCIDYSCDLCGGTRIWNDRGWGGISTNFF